MIKGFEKPTQLKVEDPDKPGGYLYGIGYRDEFICACCGGVFELEELNEDGLEIVDLGWVDLSEFFQ